MWEWNFAAASSVEQIHMINEKLRQAVKWSDEWFGLAVRRRDLLEEIEGKYDKELSNLN